MSDERGSVGNAPPILLSSLKGKRLCQRQAVALDTIGG